MKKQRVLSTNQKAIGFAAVKRMLTHLSQMQEPCIVDGDCQYRNGSGQMCVVGAIIENRYYNEGLEGEGANYPHVFQAVLASNRSLKKLPHCVTKKVLLSCQQLHDKVFYSQVQEGKPLNFNDPNAQAYLADIIKELQLNHNEFTAFIKTLQPDFNWLGEAEGV